MFPAVTDEEAAVPQVRGQPLYSLQADLAQRSGQEEPTSYLHPQLFPWWPVSEAAGGRRLGTWVPPRLQRKLRVEHQSNRVWAGKLKHPCLLLSITPHNTEDIKYTGPTAPEDR